jgi:uncharacterized membrane protein YphA (DoxX/SURF4 family)
MATNAIVQRITLEGGRELLEALKELGREGEKAFTEMQNAANKFVGPPTQLQSNFQRVEKSLNTIGTRLTNFGSSIRQAGQTFSLLGAAVGGAATAFGFLAKSAADSADAMGKASQKAGIAIDDFGALAFAAEQNDIPMETFTTSMGRLNKNIDAAIKGSGKAQAAFSQLGLSVEELQQMSPDEVFRELVEGFSGMEDGAKKSALAIELFGRGGIELIPLLNQTKAGIAELEKQFHDFGLGFTEEQARIGDEFGDNLTLLGRAIKGLKDQIGLIFVPALNEATKGILDFIKNNRESIIGFFEGVRDFFAELPQPIKAFLIALGGITITLGPVLFAIGLFVQVLGYAFSGLVGWQKLSAVEG